MCVLLDELTVSNYFNVLNTSKNDDDDMDDYYYDYDCFEYKYDSSSDYYGIYDDNNNLKCVLVVSDFLGKEYPFLKTVVNKAVFDIIYDYDDLDYARELLNTFSKLYPNILIFKGEYTDYRTYDGIYGFYDYIDPFNGTDEYRSGIINFSYIYLYSNYFLEKYDLNSLLKKYYVKDRSKIDKSNFKVKVLSSDELVNLLYDRDSGTYKHLVNEKQNNFIGFHYFTSRDLYCNVRGLKFICCFDGDFLIGVMKLGEYELNDSLDYIGLNYIDVHSYYRRLGVSKLLYKKLNFVYPPDTIFISSDLSDLGKVANLNIIRNDLVRNYPTFDNKYDYYKTNGVNYYRDGNVITHPLYDEKDNLRMVRLLNLLSTNPLRLNYNFKFDVFELCGKKFLKFRFKDGGMFMLSPDLFYSYKYNKYLYNRSKTNVESTLSSFLGFINYVNNNLVIKDSNLIFLDLLVPYLNKAFDLKFKV